MLLVHNRTHALTGAGHRPVGRALQQDVAQRYDPGAKGTVPGVVACSEIDADADGAGQGGCPVVGHDGGHGGVDPPG
jgi:hypothetical protein